MSNSTGAFGGPKTEPRVFDYRDRFVVLTPVFAYQCHDAFRQYMDIIRTVPRGRFRMEDGSIEEAPVVAEFITLPNDSHIDRARNVLLHLFEKTPYRFALFIDSDIEPKPEDIVRLWQHMMHGRELVCGLYAMKTIVPTFVANVAKGAVTDPVSGLIELNDGGTGCMAINRKVLDAFREKWPERRYRFAANTSLAADTGFAYMTSGVVERGGFGDWLSEDWKFCHDWKTLGGKVWGDTQIRLHHWGPFRFPPDVIELLESVRVLTSEGSVHFGPDIAESRALVHEHLAKLIAWRRAKQAPIAAPSA